MTEIVLTSIVFWAVPFVLVASLIEAIVLHRRAPGSYDWKAAGVSVADQIMRRLIVLLPLTVATPVYAWA